MNKKIIIYGIFILIIIILGATSYKVIKDNNEKLRVVTEKKIIEAFIKCEKEFKCKDHETLKALEEKKYLSNEFDPVSKKIYNKDSYVKKESNKYSFVIIK